MNRDIIDIQRKATIRSAVGDSTLDKYINRHIDAIKGSSVDGMVLARIEQRESYRDIIERKDTDKYLEAAAAKTVKEIVNKVNEQLQKII